MLETPPGTLGVFNDAWGGYLQDIGFFGPDQGKGGKYLVLPPDYQSEIPDGYFVVPSKTYRVLSYIRAFIAEGLEAVTQYIKDQLRIYPLCQKDNPPEMEFISGSGKSFNTIFPNDYTFYEHLHRVIDGEHIGILDPETRGFFASIGIEKGKPFAPDDRMKQILTDAIKIANATARSIVWFPRTKGTMQGIQIYPDTDSAWQMLYVDKNVFFNGQDGQTMNYDAWAMFYYPYVGVTPAQAVGLPGRGSDYAIAYIDSEKNPFDGSKTYQLHLPPDPPVENFWDLTLYDNQTRSMLQTSQAFPTVGSQTEGLQKNDDGSYDIYFGPDPPRRV
ncbi:hypothetical protein RT761_00058 [Atribacter laminatus]|uniref:DUF1254 domain-containing protein n=1 Tax=Atribacter laminatus TaxID=2847778 RepID=A0A7T1F1N3_ATRLM|nr:hypothetical protein RT761_00058 [Atribacter laminatus]